MNREKLLLVIDMQNDFVTGTLANREAEGIIEAIAEKIESYQRDDHPVFLSTAFLALNGRSCPRAPSRSSSDCRRGSVYLTSFCGCAPPPTASGYSF